MQTFALSGLSAPASLRIDTWGLAHIRAQSLQDAFYLQGFNAARDRLWQIDLWRKRGLGRLAEDFGPGYLMQDRAARLFLYRGDMAPEWAAYGPDAEEICTAFAAGINAAIDAVEAGSLPLPPEFAAFGTRPARWTAEDVVRIRSHCLTRNATSELARARVQSLADAEVDLLRVPLSPPVPDDAWATIAGADLPADALAVYELAFAPVTFSHARLAATLEEAPLWSAVDVKKTVTRADLATEGSNNWAISGELTETGRPLMASDPHRAHSAPSLRYMVHLKAPGLDLIGAGEPSSPGIMAGHNGTAAFSLTIFCADQEDVLVCDLPVGEENRYIHGDGTREVTRLDETFRVKGAPDQVLTLEFTHHGPVLWRDLSGPRLLTLRTVFTEPGTAPYMASLKSMRATRMDAFRRAVESWGAPSVNLVYADTAGDICWQPAGYIPRRTGWHGLAPVAGDGRFEWAGLMNAGDLPALCNPDRGFVHSANEMNLPAEWDHAAQPVGFEWFEDGRADRIAAQIVDGAAGSVAGSAALQADTFSDLAARLVACLPEAARDDAGRMLRGWDGHARAASAPALLFEVWFTSHLRPALMARMAEDTALRAALGPGNPATVTRLLEGAHPGLARKAGLADLPARDAFLVETLAAAWEDVAARFGSDPEAWRWDNLHKGYFAHAATGTGNGADVGPVATGGSGTTVMLAQYDPATWHVTHGASVRMVVDVGAWDQSVWINAPGQSGVPGDAHYDDLAPLWAEGRTVQMAFSDAAVNAVTERVLTFVPARD